MSTTETAPRPLNRSLLVLAVGTAMGIVYAPVVTELVRDWLRDENYSHGFLIPLVSLALIWGRRRDLRACPLRPSWLGLVGLLLGVCFLLLGVAGAEVFTQRVSLIAVLVSLVLYLAGRDWLRTFAFPIAFLLLAIPLPYILYYGLTGPLQAIAAKCAIGGLRVVGVPVMAEGNILHLPDQSLEVAEACSGIRSLYAFLAIGALLARSMSIPGWARVGVFLATIPVGVFGNALRVFSTALGVYVIGPQVAEGAVHELFGMIVFGGSLALFLLLRKGVRKLWWSAPSSPL